MPEFTFQSGKFYTEKEFEQLGLEIMPMDERFNDGRRKFCESEFVRRFNGDVYDGNLGFRHMSGDKGQWVRWTGKSWILVCETDVRIDINNLLACARNQYKPANWKNNVYDTIKSNVVIPWNAFDDTTGVAMEDGVYRIVKKRYERSSFRKEDYCTNFLPFTLANKKSKAWKQVLRNLFDDADDVKTLQEMFGACIFPGFHHQVIFHLHGGSGGGKTTVVSLLQMILKDHCTGVSLSSVKHDTHALAALSDSWVNIDSEAKIVEEEAEQLYKRISGGDLVTINPKYLGAYQKVLNAKLVILTNDLPRFHDHTQALWDRLVVIPFAKKQEGREISDVLSELKQGLSAIVSWAFAGLYRLLSRDGARRLRFTQSKYANELWNDNKEISNPFLLWLRERVIVGEGVLNKQLAYEDYRDYLHRGGFMQTSRASFFVQMKNAFPRIEERRIRATLPSTDRFRAWVGLKLLDPRNIEETV